MTLRIVPDLEESVEIINCFGTLNASGTAWTIDAVKSKQWAVKAKQNSIRALYTIPGMKLIIR